MLLESGAQGCWKEPGTAEGLSGGSCSREEAWSLPETTPQAERGRSGLTSPYHVPSRFLLLVS